MMVLLFYALASLKQQNHIIFGGWGLEWGMGNGEWVMGVKAK
ncbi:hypothetical protein NIES3275_16940 [Microchaete diplosiphon NIES-3275]|nr:hypothetical protein NIES3275_16940 [Microchaete diplosiphon NIES-3275]